MIELIKTTTGMIEHPVEHNAHAALMDLVEQHLEGRITAKYWIDLIIVMRMVAMVGGGLKDRAEIQCVHPEVSEIVEAFDNTQQVPSFETRKGRGTMPGFRVLRLLNTCTDGRAIWKDLIEDGILYPFWGYHHALRRLGHHNLCLSFHVSVLLAGVWTSPA
jgi:hypothetical protein